MQRMQTPCMMCYCQALEHGLALSLLAPTCSSSTYNKYDAGLFASRPPPGLQWSGHLSSRCLGNALCLCAAVPFSSCLKRTRTLRQRATFPVWPRLLLWRHLLWHLLLLWRLATWRLACDGPRRREANHQAERELSPT